MKKFLITGVLVLGLVGCGQFQGNSNRNSGADAANDIPSTNAEGQLRPRSRPMDFALGQNAIGGGAATARTAEEFDTTTAAQRSLAGGGGSTGRALGETVASLGNPAESGFWLKTPLIDRPAKGRVTSAQTGKSAQVELMPIDGANSAGSRISLAALRLLGLPLTALPTVSVFVE